VELENNSYQMVISMKGNIKVENLQEKENIYGKMELYLKVNFYQDIAMGKVV
jgi:hypothetical protein